MARPRLRSFAVSVLLVATTALARAQSLSGALSDESTGPLTSGVHSVRGLIEVPAGRTLTIEPGAILKFERGSGLSVRGKLLVRGTAARPVIFTDVRDDSSGGDSNGDGLSKGAAGSWSGISLESSAAGSSLEYAQVRYAGAEGSSAFFSAGDAVSLTNCRAERCAAIGFRLYAAARADYLVAHHCGGPGIRLDGSSVDVHHASVYGCRIGIEKHGTAWSGSIVDPSAWGNTLSYSAVPSLQIRYAATQRGSVLANTTVDSLVR